MIEKLTQGPGWIIFLRGILLLIFGIIAVVNGAGAIQALIFWFVVFAIADGLIAVVGHYTQRHDDPNWAAKMGGGIAGIALGLIVLFVPKLATGIFILLVAVRMMFWGGELLLDALLGRVQGTERLLAGVAGAASFIVAIALLLEPVTVIVDVMWLIGLWGIALGLYLLMIAFTSAGPNRPAAA